MMLLHKSTFNLYLECWVAAAQKHTVDVENILEKNILESFAFESR